MELKSVIKKISMVENAILRVWEYERQKDYCGAWENLEEAQRKFPDDNQLNQLHAELTGKAPFFVKAIQTAEDHEKKGQLGSSLAWYLQAKELYPVSKLANKGVNSILKKLSF